MKTLNLQSSQLTAFYECPRKWYYQYYRWRGDQPSSAMLKGTCFHLLGELNLKDNVELTDLIDVVKDTRPELAPYTTEAFMAYLRWLSAYEDSKYKLFDIEGKPSIEVEFQLALSDDILFWGKFDQLRTDGSKTYIFDWKVTSAYLNDYFFRKFELSPQTFSYSFAAREFFPDMDGFFIDGVQIKDSKLDVQRRYFPLVPALEEFISETTRIGEWIIAHQHCEDYFEHRWTACINKYNRKCCYADVCLASPHRREAILQSDLFVDIQPIYDFGD